jgi:hypothetical protein
MLSSPRKSTNLDKHIPAVAEADGQPVAVQDHAMPASESSHGDASQVNACETVVASGRKSPVKQTVGSNGSSASCDVQSLVSKYEEPPRQAKTKGQLKKQLRRKQELCAKAVTPIISGSDSYSSSLQVTSDTGGLSVSSQSSVSSAMDLMECKNLVVDSCHQVNLNNLQIDEECYTAVYNLCQISRMQCISTVTYYNELIDLYETPAVVILV